MTDDLSILKQPVFETALNEWDDLMTQSGRAFLIGAGCSKCAGLPLTAELTAKSLISSELNATTKEILSGIQAQFAGATAANIEDYLSELVDLLAIAERRNNRGATSDTAVLGGKAYKRSELQDALDQIKLAIADAVDLPVTMAVHWDFIKAVQRPLRPGRSVTARPIDYLVLNYDTLIESSLALEKQRYADGMSGGNCAWWDLQSFSSKGLSARVLKLHGSIDWSEMEGDPLPRRICRRLILPGTCNRRVLIWPASTKYREAQRDPYAQLAELSRRALRPPSGSQTVLTICGYSFGDSHINIELERALRESGGELTIVAFASDSEPTGDLLKWHLDGSITDQVRIYAKNGFFHGAISERSTADLPWWKFENITRLLAAC